MDLQDHSQCSAHQMSTLNGHEIPAGAIQICESSSGVPTALGDEARRAIAGAYQYVQRVASFDSANRAIAGAYYKAE